MEDKINKLKNTIIALSKKNKDEETSKYLDELINWVKENETNSIFNIGYKVLDSIETDTFSIIRTENGIIYKERNHYAVFVEPSFFKGNPIGLYGALYSLFNLQSLIEIKDTNLDIAKYKEFYENQLDVLKWVLSSPRIASTSEDSLIDFAILVVQYFQKIQEKCFSQLNEETEEDIAENKEFESKTQILQDIFENLKKNETK